jgi:His-Xaa-Ser system radical SAM maturase HxsB
MRYQPEVLPFRSRRLDSDYHVAVSESGDFAFLTNDEVDALTANPARLPLKRQAELQSRFFLGTSFVSSGSARLLASRRAAKRETVDAGPSLHILVPTLQCGHSCQYCQVSRSLDDESHAMSPAVLDSACDAIFESPAQSLTIEFQGGDPLLRFDLVKRAIQRIAIRNIAEGRRLRFVVASTLHQLDESMCAFFNEHQVYLSTSIDGPAWLHDKNRPIPGRDGYKRTVNGIALARRLIGAESVSALMTTTRAALAHAEAIVDEYVQLGFADIFIRPMSAYGFAKRNQTLLGYSTQEFQAFYVRAIERILDWNRRGIPIREVYAGIVLNKALSTFDGGYVDLQSPTGAGSSVLVYNYDGYIYPSDEARMLTETGDHGLRMASISQRKDSRNSLLLQEALRAASDVHTDDDCKTCAYNQYCGPNPVDAYAQHGSMYVRAGETEHCKRHLWMFDYWFRRIRQANPPEMDLMYAWASLNKGDATCGA